MTDILPAAYRHMDYCSICLQSPGRCTCPKPATHPPEESASPEMPPLPAGEQALPIDWPERGDIV